MLAVMRKSRLPWWSVGIQRVTLLWMVQSKAGSLKDTSQLQESNGYLSWTEGSVDNWSAFCMSTSSDEEVVKCKTRRNQEA